MKINISIYSKFLFIYAAKAHIFFLFDSHISYLFLFDCFSLNLFCFTLTIFAFFHLIFCLLRLNFRILYLIYFKMTRKIICLDSIIFIMDLAYVLLIIIQEFVNLALYFISGIVFKLLYLSSHHFKHLLCFFVFLICYSIKIC